MRGITLAVIMVRDKRTENSHPTSITTIEKIFSALVFGLTFPNPMEVREENVNDLNVLGVIGPSFLEPDHMWPGRATALIIY